MKSIEPQIFHTIDIGNETNQPIKNLDESESNFV